MQWITFGLLYLSFHLLFSDILWILRGTPGLRAYFSCLCRPDRIHASVQERLQQAWSWVFLSLQLTFFPFMYKFMLVMLKVLFYSLGCLLVCGFWSLPALWGWVLICWFLSLYETTCCHTEYQHTFSWNTHTDFNCILLLYDRFSSKTTRWSWCSLALVLCSSAASSSTTRTSWCASCHPRNTFWPPSTST